MPTDKNISKRTKRTRRKNVFPNRHKYADGIAIGMEKGRKSPYLVKYRPQVGKATTKYFATPEDADKFAMELTGKVRRDGEGFHLTESEKAAVLLWRKHREERLLAGKASLTLEKAIQTAMDAEIASDVASPLISDVFHEFSLHKEKEAKGSNNESAGENARRMLREIERCLDVLGNGARMDMLESVESIQNIETHLQNTLTGRDGGYPTKTTMMRYRRELSVFLNWACKRGVLKRNAIDLLPVIQEAEPPRCVFTPDELKKVLQIAERLRPESLPWLVLGAFCGIRPRELTRVTWEDIDLTEGVVRVSHGKSKTGDSRLVPLGDTGTTWLLHILADNPKPSGHLIPGDTPQRREWSQRRVIDLLKNAGIEWKHDVLRHSFASYACARGDGHYRVAEWLGNSPAIMHKHYRQTRSRNEALKWFSVLPKKET